MVVHIRITLRGAFRRRYTTTEVIGLLKGPTYMDGTRSERHSSTERRSVVVLEPTSARGTPRSDIGYRTAIGLILVGVVFVACARAEDGEGGGDWITLPAEVTVPADFERDHTGLAVDLEAAEERFYQCMEDAGYPVADLSVEDLMARNEDPSEPQFREIHTACTEAAGTGWSPGNRPDEAAARNRQAWATTECVRAEGLEWPDPRPEPWERYLDFSFDQDILASATAATDREQSEVVSIVGRCVEDHAIDWEEWFTEHPRN